MHGDDGLLRAAYALETTTEKQEAKLLQLGLTTPTLRIIAPLFENKHTEEITEIYEEVTGQPAPFDTRKEEDILLEMLQIEQLAYDFYHTKRKLATNPKVQNLFNELAQAELQHMKLIEKALEIRFHGYLKSYAV